MAVTGHNSETGKVRLAEVEDAEDAVAERIAAYDSYDADLTSAWRDTADAQSGDACTTVGGQPGRFCLEGGNLVCRSLRAPSGNEWAIAGPLSDSGQNVKDAAYSEYEQNLCESWRR